MKTIEELEAELETITRERDEARAEVARLRELLDENAYERGLLARRMTEAQARRDAAYRRGAEAMREASAVLVSNEKRLWLRSELIADLRALPIPGEP
jgi:chromosome segregation ATPase